MWNLEEADEMRRLMGINRVKKEPGCSWIDYKNTTYVFKVHDRSNYRTRDIYKMLEKLEELVKQKGYVGETAIDDSENRYKSLWYHSEKLALSFGLLTHPVGASITIKKNLRTCTHCHSYEVCFRDFQKRNNCKGYQSISSIHRWFAFMW